MDEYVPVPVEAARAIADRYGKQVVVVYSYDHAHALHHTTTFGESPRQKVAAADMGAAVMEAAGGVGVGRSHEDFRHRPAAEAQAEIDALRRRVAELEAAAAVDLSGLVDVGPVA